MSKVKSLLREAVYRSVEKVSSGRGIKRVMHGETIRFPVRWSRYFEPTYEPGTFAFFRENCHRGHTVLDIGAHLGLFSVVAARHVGRTGRVYAFEPTPFVRSVLQQVACINDCSHIIRVRGEAISESTGQATFHDTGDVGSNANSLIESGRSQNGFTVPTITIDDFVQQHGLTPHVIKIDVEGAEGGVLRGASHTFKTFRPMALLSLHPHGPKGSDGFQMLSDIWEMLQQYEMRVSMLQDHSEYAAPRPVDTHSNGAQLEYGQEIEGDWFRRQTELFDVQLTPREKHTAS